MNRLLILLLFLHLFATNGNAQSENYSDADKILYKHIITSYPGKISSLKADKRFTYVKNLDSLLKLKDEQAMDIRESKNSTPSFLQLFLSSDILQIILWLLAISAVFFILYRLFLSNGIFKRAGATLPVKEKMEEYHPENVSGYDALIQQSYKLADYRMATRYLFLKTLRQLADKGVLQSSVDKTNYQYLQEIPADKKPAFSSLVLNYEYVWYGNILISREKYAEIEKQYQVFYNKI